MRPEAPNTRSCIDCGYDLRNLSSRVCPECGRDFDPNNPATFVGHQASGLDAAKFAMLGLALTSATPLGIGIAMLLETGILGAIVYFLSLASFAGIVVSVIAMGRGIHGWRHSPWAKHRWAFVATLLIGFLASVCIPAAIIITIVTSMARH